MLCTMDAISDSGGDIRGHLWPLGGPLYGCMHSCDARVSCLLVVVSSGRNFDSKTIWHEDLFKSKYCLVMAAQELSSSS